MSLALTCTRAIFPTCPPHVYIRDGVFHAFMTLYRVFRFYHETVITMEWKWTSCPVLLERHDGSSGSSGVEELGKSGL